MRVIPQDLDDLLGRLPDHTQFVWPHAGIINAFIRICDGLQPEMVWPAEDSTRADWLANLEDARFWVARSSAGKAQDALSANILHNLQDIAHKTWRGPQRGLARELPFVKDLELRKIAERDLSSLNAARKTDETKVSLILAGCVIEGVLTDVLERDSAASEKAARGHPEFAKWGKRFDATKPAEWDFIRKIDVCGPHGLTVLSNKTVVIANSIRQSRNLVQPHLERDEVRRNPLRPSDAAVAEGLVLKIIDEVADWRNTHP